MPIIDYFYSAHSAYAYLGHQQLLHLCKAHDCTLAHRPMALSPVMEAMGGVPFAKRSEKHNAYFFDLEIKRWSHMRDVPIMEGRPAHHNKPYDLANCLLIAAADQGCNVDELAGTVLRAHWLNDADLSDETQLASVIEAEGLEPVALLRAARSPGVQSQHYANTREAIARSVFGSPTYFLNGEMFYGQDRLEMMDHALSAKLTLGSDPSSWR